MIRSLELCALSEEDTEELLALALDLNRKLRAELKRIGVAVPSDGAAVSALWSKTEQKTQNK